MRFFDANTCIGLPATPAITAGVAPGVSSEQLLAAMDRAGIERALVWHVAQRDCDPATGNDLLAAAIGPHERLLGCWSVLPPQPRECADLDAWLVRAAAAKVKAMRAFAEENNYLLRPEAMGAVLARLVAARIPLILSPQNPAQWNGLYDLLAETPELTVIVADQGPWGRDRYFRPLIRRYPNVYVELSRHMLDGGIEDFVAELGPRRMLFGSGFPACYHGPMMLALAHAKISPDDRQAIAAGNLERLVAEVKL